MKKNVKEVENLIYKSNNISLHRIDNTIHLFGYQDFSLNEIFEIIIWGIKNNIDDEEFWNIKITLTDKQAAKPINIIYWLTGGDKIWKNSNWIWKNDWNEMSIIFLEHFEDKIKKMIRGSKTTGDLKNKILDKISSEDFYELGLMLQLINIDDTLL